MKVREAALLMGAIAEDVSAELFDKEITDFSIDSRSVNAGEVFFALSQEDYARAGFNGTFADAHEYIEDALAKGAIAAVAREKRVRGDRKLTALQDRLLLVDDVIAALQMLAHRVYEAWGKPVVGITGSAGKTTAKELTAHLLNSTGSRVLKSERNYNNGLGLPLSVLRMVSEGRSPEQFDVAVLEMGMSSPTHEIQRLCRITPPDIGVELMIAPVHLEYLGSIENIAAAKAELVEGLKPGGIAILNADDEWVIRMRDKHQGRTVTFGMENPADVAAKQIDTSHLGLVSFRLQTPLGEAPATLPMSGRHNLMNALAAAAVATCFELEPARIAAALSTAKPPRMRGEVLDFAAGFRVVDDSYNSNPRSLINMVRTISEGGTNSRRRIVIAGEMLELGPDEASLHRESGREIGRAGVDVLWGVRGLAAEIVAGANEAGLTETTFFETSDEAARAIVKELREGDLVLVKGSRGVATDRIVTAIRKQFPLAGSDDEGEEA
ncbi:MAG TPA: UDP-N-acetylmuramoyl-tripeptide--D-alanyl-D-alanine ligase [Blastocatellia bacterium]|nr:UDP-N-acetylmuramoyl-tripeptide--D-alanyl-D-alanine ligase [Blastocatellia bacterium]HCX28316.1 UDP-N-acetylmuramoyl-tripeptide--D-alanyl-D-alanine ligase [Blastocatellia bacterium]